MDYLIQDILTTENPKLIKVDIARAFPNVRIDPGDALNLCIAHGGQYFLDNSLAFGPVHGTAICQRITDAIRRIMASTGIPIWNYIDDLFACIRAAEVDQAFACLKELVQDLGLPIKDDKLVSPSDRMVCMGIEEAEDPTY